MKLHQFLGRTQSLSKRKVLEQLQSGAVTLNGATASDPSYLVKPFDEVRLNDALLQAAIPRLYLALNKPAGILSATKDAVHRTVIDLIDLPYKETLHLAGRLDRASTGLMLLTNDGAWSQALTEPDKKVEKIYLVGTSEPLKSSDIEAFERGFYFHTEDITTQPAKLEILEPHLARVTLVEGRYHQIKRMFHRVKNRVTSLHRIQIGKWCLDERLPEGAWRELEASER